MARNVPEQSVEDRESRTEKSGNGDRSSILNSQSSILSDEICPACNSPRTAPQEYCDSCGLVFASFAPPTIMAPIQRLDSSRLRGRYQLGELISSRGDVCRYRGLDFAVGTPEPVAVVILKGPPVSDPLAVLAGKTAASSEDEVLPSFDDHLTSSSTETVILPF